MVFEKVAMQADNSLLGSKLCNNLRNHPKCGETSQKELNVFHIDETCDNDIDSDSDINASFDDYFKTTSPSNNREKKQLMINALAVTQSNARQYVNARDAMNVSSMRVNNIVLNSVQATKIRDRADDRLHTVACSSKVVSTKSSSVNSSIATAKLPEHQMLTVRDMCESSSSSAGSGSPASLLTAHSKRKRKFPGPAGILPEIVRNPKLHKT